MLRVTGGDEGVEMEEYDLERRWEALKGEDMNIALADDSRGEGGGKNDEQERNEWAWVGERWRGGEDAGQ